MQLVVPSAVRNAVSAATTTFTANSITLCFFILGFLFCLGRTRMNTECSVKIEFRENPCHSVAIRLTVALVIRLRRHHIRQRRLLLESLLLTTDGANLALHQIPEGKDAVLLQCAARQLLALRVLRVKLILMPLIIASGPASMA